MLETTGPMSQHRCFRRGGDIKNLRCNYLAAMIAANNVIAKPSPFFKMELIRLKKTK
jgi:hypothetical protein